MILGYVRCSTVEQAADHKSSLETQENIIRGYAMMNNRTKFDVQIYTDAGVSGSVPLDMREGGKALLEAATTGDVIVASKMDRIFRAALDALKMVDYLKEKGIDLVLFDMGTQSVLRDGPSKLFFTMLAGFAEFERGRIVERITAGKVAKKQRGGHIGGEAPYGYRVEGAGQMACLVPDDAEQRVVERIRQRITGNFSALALAKELAQQGIYTRAGKPFTSTQIKRIVESVRTQ